MKPDSTTRLWKKRIQAARERREPYEELWQQYATLHTAGSLCADNPEKDKLVAIPGRKDMVKLGVIFRNIEQTLGYLCLLYTSPSPRDRQKSRMPSSA